MKTEHSHAEPATYAEIMGQPAAWQEALQVVDAQASALHNLWSAGDYASAILTGCGSTYYLALAAAALLQEWTGLPVRGVPAGELIMYPAAAYPARGRTLLVAISRSAATTETVRAAQAFQEGGRGDLIVVTNYGGRPLSAMGAINLVVPAGQERSVAQTRSFASMYVAMTAVAAALARRQELRQAMQGLPEQGRQILSRYEGLAQSLGRDLALDRFYFLGSGPRYGLACETSLKMKEMSLSHSEPFHFLEFRHGPKSMVTPSTLAIGLLSEANRPLEATVLQDVRDLGGRTLTLSESKADVAFASQLPEPVRNVLYLPVLQQMAYYRALAKGLNPDQPTHLDAVVRLK